MKLVIATLLIFLSLSTAQNQHELKIIGEFAYKNNYYGKGGCNLEIEPCADLNDIWSYSFVENGVTHYFAIVGLSNGIDIVDVTNPNKPERVKWIQGCNNIWRDMKVWGHKVYAISEYTQTCACTDPNHECLEKIQVLEPPSLNGTYEVTEGRISVPLNTIGPIIGNVVPVIPWDDKGCDFIENNLTNSIALIPDGDCMYSMKFLMAQQAGAKAVIIVNKEDLIIYPGMSGVKDGINISGVMIGKTDGLALKQSIDNGIPVSVNMSSQKYQSNFFTAPEGLTILDLSDPWNPKLEQRWRRDFDFAHNLGLELEFGRPYMYVVGMSNIGGNVANGGIYAYDVSNQTADPNLVWVFNDTYIHDTSVQYCDGSYILVGAAIYDDLVFMWNVTNIPHVTQLGNFSARHGWAHNVYLDKDCSTLYVTHEEYNEPISVWKLFKDSLNYTLWNVPPKYIGSLNINQFDDTLPHNVYVNDTTLYSAYYSMGVIAWNITNPTRPAFMAQKDTNTNFTGGFHGVWGLYPHHPLGYIYASDMEAGLFILKMEEVGQTPQGSSQQITVIALGSLLGIAALVIIGLLIALFRRPGNQYTPV